MIFDVWHIPSSHIHIIEGHDPVAVRIEAHSGESTVINGLTASGQGLPCSRPAICHSHQCIAADEGLYDGGGTVKSIMMGDAHYIQLSHADYVDV